MFAPKLAKPQAKVVEAPVQKLAPRRSTPAAGQSGQDLAYSSSTSGVSWDFSKIPVFSPDRASRPPRTPPLAATSPVLQAKLVTGEVNNPLELQADQVAERVTRMPAPVIPAMTASKFSRKAVAESVPGIVHEALRSSGQPLDTSTRAFFEPRFGYDFSGVRLHVGAGAAESAQALNALAYTVGSHIVFGAEQHQPTTHGKHLLAHELTHVVQNQSGLAAMDAVQRAPDDAIEVTVVEVSRSESELLFFDYGIRLPGSPPSVQFGNDGPIPAEDRKAVQLGFDLAYTTATTPGFATKLGEFKQKMGKGADANIPGSANLSQQKYLTALSLMVIHLADTSKNPLVTKLIQDESKGAGLPTAGFTPIGGNNVYFRAFALKEGQDALASLILHESFHVAGVPTKPINEFLELVMEVGAHGFEASVGLPLSQIAAKAGTIESVKPHGQGLQFIVTIAKPEDLPSSTVTIEIFDGNREKVFSSEIAKQRLTRQIVWNGLKASGRPTESGIHSIRVLAGATLIAARDYILRRS
jgi:hypothetical protein